MVFEQMQNVKNCVLVCSVPKLCTYTLLCVYNAHVICLHISVKPKICN